MYNQCTFIGNLGADPEIRRTQAGKPIANLRIAVTEKWRDQSGERREKTEWIPVVIFSEGLCKIAEQYLRKGSKILVTGKWQTRKWQDQSGQDRYSTECVLQGFDAKLVMLDGNSNGTSGQRQSDYTQNYRPGQDHMTQNTGSNGPSGYGGGSASMDDDTIPF